MDVKPVPGMLLMLDGIRVLSMGWIILAHTYFLPSLASGLWDNFSNLINERKYLLNQAVIRGALGVDTFLLLSGLLLVFTGLRKVEDTKNSLQCFGKLLFHRIIRVSPAYYMTIAWVVGPSDYVLGGGPFWPTVVQWKNDCLQTWWKSLIYISNFGDTSHMCAGHTWYLSVDMQLHIVGFMLLILLHRWRNIGIFLISLCVVSSCVVAGVISYLEHIPSSSLLVTVSIPQIVAYSTDFYIKPYCRMGPFAIGMLIGCLILYGDEFKKRIKPVVAYSLWFVAVIVILAVIYGTYGDFLSTQEPDRLQGSVYNAMSGTAWSLGVGWVIYACYVGYGGLLSSFLSLKLWIPLSRLTYCAYLIHYIVEYTFYFGQESKFHFDHFLMMILFFGFLMTTYGLSFLFALAFEVPFSKLEKIFQEKCKTFKPTKHHYTDN